MKLLKITLVNLILISFFVRCGNENSYSKVSHGKLTEQGNMLIRIVKKKEIVLNTGEDVIGFVMDVKITDNNILVIDPIYSRKCFYFNHDGKLLFTSGTTGEGPGEVPMLCAACISGEKIFVFGNYRLNIYSRKNGKEIRTIKKPFRAICNSIYSGSDRTVFALSNNRYNKNKNTIYHLDENGKLINSFSKAEDVPKVFDTFYPQTGLFVDSDKIYQFFNYKYEISVFDYNGKILNRIKLKSKYYTEPNMKKAKHVKPRKEKEFRASFTQITGFFKHSKGFVALLTNWKNSKTNQVIVEFWSNKFNKIGSCEFNENSEFVHYSDDMFITIDVDNNPQKIEFWDIVFKKNQD